MTEQFNDEEISKNLSVFMGEKAGEYLSHHVTENEYLEKLDPMELEEIKQDLVYHLIRKRQENMRAEEIKQDCETKAFFRLAERIKKRFRHLPILLLADSLYESNPVMELCREYKWEFLIRYKKGSVPSMAEEYEKIPEKGRAGKRKGIPMTEQHEDNERECRKDGRNREKTVEDRE